MQPDPSQYYGIGSAVLIVPIVQFFKMTFPELPSRYWPAVTLATAIVFNLALAQFILHGDLAMAVLVGLIAGLSASGLYSWATTMVPGLKDEWGTKVMPPRG